MVHILGDGGVFGGLLLAIPCTANHRNYYGCSFSFPGGGWFFRGYHCHRYCPNPTSRHCTRPKAHLIDPYILASSSNARISIQGSLSLCDWIFLLLRDIGKSKRIPIIMRPGHMSYNITKMPILHAHAKRMPY